MKEVFLFIFVVLLCHVHSGPINNIYEDTTPAPPPPEYRLNSDFNVENYDVVIEVGEIKTAKTFDGVVQIKLKATKKTDLIRLHVGKNMETIKFTDLKAKTLNEDGSEGDAPINEIGTELTPDPKSDIIKIKLKNEVDINGVIILIIEKYTAKFSNDMYGFYLSTYKEGNEDITIATTQFQPTHARRAFPCLDEPQYKATFDINIIHPNNYKAISNQPESTSTTASDTVTTFETTPKMSTYLVAFVVSNFQPTTVTYDDSKCGDDAKQKCESTIWTPKYLTAYAQYAKDETPKILKELNAFTDKNYWDLKMKKLDQVAIPDFSAGAMENWGLVTYRETALLIDNQKSTARNKQRVTSVIAHEFAHMWFGNLITLDWWEFTWLNEGFASYFQYLITGLIHTKDDDDWKMDQQFVVEQIHSAFVSDGFEKTKELNHPVNSETEIKAKFDTISYNKGASVIRMLEHAIGKDIFKKKIQNYLKLGNENVTPKELYEALDNTEETKWADFMTSWTTKKGYPLITVSRKKGDTSKAETDKQTIVVKQERFLYEQPEGDAKKGEKWQIWLTSATSKGKTNPGELITGVTQDISVPKEDFLIFNVDQTGYYRVKYEGELLDELLKTLKEKPDSIPIINRAQIVDDYMNFARAGKITYVEAFKVISFLENEEEYLPWYAALNSFSFLRRRFADGNIRKSIDEQMGTLMKKVITNAKFETENVKHFEMLKKVLILQWACEINEQNCVSKAKQLFEDYKKSETNPGTTTTEGTTTTDGTTTTTEGTTTTTDGTTTTTEGTTTTTEGTTTTTEGTTTTTEGTTTTTDGTTTTTDGTTTKETTTEETTTETTTEETTTETTTEETTTETTTEETTTETTTEETTTETTTEETTTETTTEETTTETTTEETTTEETTTEETTTEETTTEDTTTEETTTTEKAGSGDVKRDVKRAISMKESGGYANVHGIVLCAGLRNSDKEEDWEFVKGLLDTKTFPQEQATIVTALGCTKNVKYLEEYLQMTLDTKSRKPFRKQDKMAVFNAVLTGNPQGVDTAFKFLENKLPEIKNNFQGLNDLSEMVNNVADRLTSKTQMNEFKTFLTKNEDTLEIDITPLIDMLETNGQWIDKNEKTLENFYKKPDDGGGAAGLTISTFLLLLTTFIIKNI